MTSRVGKERFTVSDIKLRFVDDGKDGLLAWASCVVSDAIYLNNIAIRKGKNGGLLLTYPAKQTASGARYQYFNPIRAEVAQAIEQAVFGALQKLLTESPAGCMKGGFI